MKEVELTRVVDVLLDVSMMMAAACHCVVIMSNID